MDNNESSVIRFDWRHDCVCCGHINVRVSGQEKEALRLLVMAQGRVCEREDLMEAIWGTRAAYMDNLYLTQLVYRLRKALKPLGLGDHIVTMPRTGYRFDVEGLLIDAETPSRCEPEASQAARGWRERLSHALRSGWCRFHHVRRQATGAPGTLTLPAIHAESGTVTYAGATVNLTGFERTLLEAFVEQPDTTLERHALIARIWGEADTVDVNRLTRLVSRLRRSLQPLGLAQRLVYIPCVGYRFAASESPPLPAQAHGEAGVPQGAFWRTLGRYVPFKLAALLTLATLLMLANVLAAPEVPENTGHAQPVQCTRDYVHSVFLRDVSESEAHNPGAMPVAMDEAWRQIVVDLHAAGCKSVTASTAPMPPASP